MLVSIVYCGLQAVLGGNSSPSKDDITKILGSGVFDTL